MADDWQNLADDDVVLPPKVDPNVVNKWAGEDEEDDIKDSWDADDDEKKDEEKNEKPAPIKPKKSLAQKIAEKERLQAELEEKKRKEEFDNMTPEEQAAEKKRLQKLQEEADTKLALESLGMSSTANIDSFNPKTDEEFAEFADAITKSVKKFKDSDKYVEFIDGLVNKLCAGLSSINIKKINGNLSNLHLAQQKIEKGDKPKKKAAGKVKAKIRIEGDDDYNSRVGAFEADDYDDFM